MRRASLAVSVLIAACAATPDHFYTLAVLPEGAPTGLSAPTLHVLLSVRVPELVDRPELVVSTSSTGILVLEHERWGVSLSDQMVQTLARDIEKRRSDVLVADRAFDQGTRPPIRITVDIVRLTARRGERVSMEARWRIVDESAGIQPGTRRTRRSARRGRAPPLEAAPAGWPRQSPCRPCWRHAARGRLTRRRPLHRR